MQILPLSAVEVEGKGVSMDYQEKVSILKRYKDATKMIDYYKQDLLQYQETIAQAKIQRITGMPSGSGNNSDLSDYIVEIEKKKNKISDALLKAERIRTSIMCWCEQLSNVDERLVIQYRYIKFHNFGWIADELHYAERTIARKHYRAVMNLPDLDNDIPFL